MNRGFFRSALPAAVLLAIGHGVPAVDARIASAHAAPTGDAAQAPKGAIVAEGFQAPESAPARHRSRRITPEASARWTVRLADGTLLVSIWEAQGVYCAGRTYEPRLVVSGVPAPADIGVDEKRRRVLIPLLMENTLHLAPPPE